MAPRGLGFDSARALRLLAAAAALAVARADYFPNINLPHIPNPFHDDEDAPKSQCTADLLAKYPSGWPVKLDAGIYWFGKGNEFEKAEPGQPNKFYDNHKPTLLYFHGWLGSGSTEACRRVTTSCDATLCPNGGGQMIADPWIQNGWNVGFFYWDQFADEECMREAEQKIWFDREGDGLRWRSYDVATGTAQEHQYQGSALSISDLCVENVREVMGDYLGTSVRFVGRSIGSQLAVRCAAKLHLESHPAAPQRLAMLEPFFTRHTMSFFGMSVRCKQVTTEDGIEGFTSAATAKYVKGLWNMSRVVTEVYTSSKPSDMGIFGEVNDDLERHVALVEYNPQWCGDAKLACERRAVFPIYFLSYGARSPQLVRAVPQVTDEHECHVPSSSCSDAQIRALVERQLQQVDKQAWQQWGGIATFDFNDDTFTVTGPAISTAVTPSPRVEAEVSNWVEMNRDPTPKLKYGKYSLSLHTALAALLALTVVGVLTCIGYRVIAIGSLSKEDSGDSGSDEGSDDEESFSKLSGAEVKLLQPSRGPREGV